MINQPPAKKTPMEEARDKIVSLREERAQRTGGGHPDPRVPGEIARHLAAIGALQKGIRDQNERWRAGLVTNETKIAEIEELYRLLMIEFEIATFHATAL